MPICLNTRWQWTVTATACMCRSTPRPALLTRCRRKNGCLMPWKCCPRRWVSTLVRFMSNAASGKPVRPSTKSAKPAASVLKCRRAALGYGSTCAIIWILACFWTTVRYVGCSARWPAVSAFSTCSAIPRRPLCKPRWAGPATALAWICPTPTWSGRGTTLRSTSSTQGCTAWCVMTASAGWKPPTRSLI